MQLARPDLFSGRDLLWFILLCIAAALFSLSTEYRHYGELSGFDDAVIDATVVNQYAKIKQGKTYQVLKLRSEKGAFFYTTGSRHLRSLQGYTLQLFIKSDRLTFLGYLKGFFAYSKILKVYPKKSAKARLFDRIAGEHPSEKIAQIYGALFTASPMSSELRMKLSSLGVSHLLAISGFHLGVLSLILFALLKPLYGSAQEHFFPYRHGRRDVFVITVITLFAYVWFLEFVPSLLRAFAMMCVGFVLHDRGLRLISMQALFVAVLLLLSLWPRLFFTLGFWLSVGGVFFILLFLRHFSHWPRYVQFAGIHIWVYLMMLPSALYLFETFSLMHPLSVIWSMLFILFYPLSLVLHLLGFAQGLDALLLSLLSLAKGTQVHIYASVVAVHLLLSLAAVRYANLLWALGGVTLAVFISAVYQVA